MTWGEKVGNYKRKNCSFTYFFQNLGWQDAQLFDPNSEHEVFIDIYS